MTLQSNRPAFGPLVIVLVSLTLAVYFCFAAIQGDFGVMKRAEILAEANSLQSDLDKLTAQIDAMENKTRRLSDDFLDLDLLDERARDVLGLVRPDEIVIQ